MAAIFCDHAVLQREKSIPVWGWMKPCSRVAVSLGGARAESLSGSDGKFLVRLPPMPAGGPYELRAVELDSGDEALASDIHVGEVWVASGQSNMQFRLDQIGEEGRKIAALADMPGLRMFTVKQQAFAGKQPDCRGNWLEANPDNALSFSAVGYHFGAEIHRKLGVAVGIICNAWGGTRIEAWISRGTLLMNSEDGAWVERVDADSNSPEFWEAYAGMDLSDPMCRCVPTQQSFTADPGNEGFGRGWASREFSDREWDKMGLPAGWKMRGVAFNGALWFRRALELPASWAGRELVLSLGAVDKQDVTYFNGVRIGGMGEALEDRYWNVPREYKVPGSMVKGGVNLIACRAYSFAFDGGLIGPRSLMKIYPVGAEEDALPLDGEWRYAVEHNIGNVTSVLIPPGPGNPHTPGILFDNLINPLLPAAIRGVIWYQGESNAFNAAAYERQMRDLVRDWRFHWEQGDFPFLMVQLANFRMAMDYQEDSTWAPLRDAQLRCLDENGVGMAVTIDIGEELDIHPTNKHDVGARLARWALAETYNRGGVVSGPLFRRAVIEGGTIRVSFKHCGSGLTVRGDGLKTFVVAGMDRVFHPAVAVIDGDSVVVGSDKVKAPVAVRYAWADNPAGCNLYNREGLPASPFRSDSW